MNFKYFVLISFFLILINLQLNNGEEILQRKTRTIHLFLDHVSKYFGKKVNVLTGHSQFINKAPFIQRNNFRNENPTTTYFNQAPNPSEFNYGASFGANLQPSGFSTMNNQINPTTGPSKFSFPLQTDAPSLPSSTSAPVPPTATPVPSTTTEAPIPPTTVAETTTQFFEPTTTDGQIASTDAFTEEPIAATTTFHFKQLTTAAPKSYDGAPDPDIIYASDLKAPSSAQVSSQFSSPGYNYYSSNIIDSNKDYYNNQELYHPPQFAFNNQYSYQPVPSYKIPQSQPISNNYIGSHINNGQYSMSHSSVKMHDSPTNLVTYHSYNANPSTNGQYQYYGDY